LRQHAVDLFADPPVLAVDDVVDGDIAGQHHLPQVAEHVVVVAGGGNAFGPALQLAVGGVGVGGAVVGQQPVLGVIAGHGLAVDVGAVAVGVVAVGGADGAVPL